MPVDPPAVTRGVVGLKLLPEPDILDLALPEGATCLVTDDGSALTAEVVKRMQARGWKVVVLRFPTPLGATQSVGFAGARAVQLESFQEEPLQTTLARIEKEVGRPAVFVHLHPACESCREGKMQFPETSRQIVQSVFLMAKHLKAALNESSSGGRAAFLSVTRLDGALGVGGTLSYDPIGGGLMGLVKSLNLEWESVYCRGVDLDPRIGAEEAARLVMAELLDPNRRVVEVGYGPSGRVTLALEPA